MTQPPVSSRSSAGPRSPVTAHPVISAVIAILVLASIFFAVYVPLYASATPKVGDFPFFYFFLLAYMPVLGIVMWIVIMLQRRLRPAQGVEGRETSAPGEVAR